MQNRVAIVVGASRGIGRECALHLARKGVTVVVAAKSDQPVKDLPGTIHTVVEEIRRFGGKAKAVKLDIQNESEIEQCVRETLESFGRIDILVNNASALYWKRMEDTPTNRFDLMMRINARGTFLMTKAVLPAMAKNNWGHIINMSPPIRFDASGSVSSTTSLSGRVGYTMSKFGMTLVALGVAAEYAGKNIAGNTLWPRTLIESTAVENFRLSNRSNWRKADILAECVTRIVEKEPNSFTGRCLIDEEFLRGEGVTDFRKYRCDPDVSFFETIRSRKKETRARLTGAGGTNNNTKVEPPSMDELAKMDKSVFERGRAAEAQKRAHGEAKL